MEIFNRVEQKYVLTKEQYKKIFLEIEPYLEKDYYYQSKICNLYFDNENNDFIINSLEKPIFKEKIRIRSYGVPNLEDIVFLERKGKYNGVVFKRRIEIKLLDLYKYLETGEIKDKYNNQVMKEMDYIIKKFDLKPKIFIGYDRLSYYDKNNINFRVTFDSNLRSREDELLLELGDNGNLYKKDLIIMEVKSLQSIPLWFIKVLSDNNIYSNSFSKYGEIYRKKKENKQSFCIIKEKKKEKELKLNYREVEYYV